MAVEGLKLDPSRAFEPARKTITSIEAQRVMTVLEDTISKIEQVNILPYLINNIDRFRVSLGSDLANQLEKHHVLQDGYRQIKDHLDGLHVRQHSNQRLDTVSVTCLDSKIERTKRIQSIVRQQLSISCKNILRLFASNHSALQTIMVKAAVPPPNEQLVSLLKELKDFMMHKLLTTPGEEKELIRYIQEASQRNNDKIDEAFKAALTDKEEQIEKKNVVIRRLQADIHRIQTISGENINNIKKEAGEKEAALIKKSDKKRELMMQDLAELKTKLQNLRTEHINSEVELRRRKFRVETQINSLIQRYDVDMVDKQIEYKDIDAVYGEEKKELHELEKRFKTLETEYQQIMEERRIAREKREITEQEDMANIIKASNENLELKDSKTVVKEKKKKKKRCERKKKETKR